MLDKSAIQELKLSQSVNDANAVLLERFKEFGSDGAVLPTVVVPNDCTTVSFEKFLEFRTRFSGQFETFLPAQFAQYCKHYFKQYNVGSAVFINSEQMTAKAVLDLGTVSLPGHCAHNAKIKCRKLAAFKAVESICDRRMSQMELSNFIEDWKSNVAVIGQTGDEMLHGVAVTAVRKATVEKIRAIDVEVGDFENSASVSERRAAKNKDDLPKYINFTCVPYEGFDEETIVLRVGMNTSDDIPSFVVRMVAEEEIREKHTELFKERLITELGGNEFPVFVGDFSS